MNFASVTPSPSLIELSVQLSIVVNIRLLYILTYASSRPLQKAWPTLLFFLTATTHPAPIQHLTLVNILLLCTLHMLAPPSNLFAKNITNTTFFAACNNTPVPISFHVYTVYVHALLFMAFFFVSDLALLQGEMLPPPFLSNFALQHVEFR